MSIEKYPHDWLFKTIFSKTENLKTFLNLFLPQVYQNVIPETIKLSNTEKITKKYKKFLLDLSFECKIRDSKGKIIDGVLYLVFEHKSYLDIHTPSQILFYKASLMEEDEKERRSYRAVIPIVFYHGKEKWNIPNKIPDLSNFPKKIKEFATGLNYILVDTSDIKDDFLLKNLYLNACLLSSLYILKNIFTKDLDHLRPILEKLILEDIKDCLYIIIDYTVIVKKDIEKIEKMLEEIGGKEKMMTLTEKWKMEGLLKGREEGLKQGIQEGMILDAQESIIDFLEAKFGFVPDKVKVKIKAINDINLLRNLRKKIAKIDKIEDFIREI